jgi:hypothetical protein
MAVEQIREKLHLISNEECIWKETCILDKKLTSKSFEIIEDVRKHYTTRDFNEEHEVEECEDTLSYTSSCDSSSDEDESGDSESGLQYHAHLGSSSSDSNDND